MEKEKELWVEGEFVTEEEMLGELKLKPARVAAVKEECAKTKGMIRQGLLGSMLDASSSRVRGCRFTQGDSKRERGR